MTHEKLVINGVTYVPETTEPVKRERKHYFIKSDNLIALWRGNQFVFGRVGYACGDAPNAAELFEGEIIISMEELLWAIFKESHYEDIDEVRTYCARVFRNLKDLK